MGLATVIPGRAWGEDLLEKYPTTLTRGLFGAANARACEFTTNDLFQLSRFRLAVGDQLKLETGPATLGLGHCSGGATWAVIIPDQPGSLTRGSSDPEEVAHIWVRFHPQEINRLFPVATVRAGTKDISAAVRRIVAGKFNASYHVGNRAMIPEPKDMTVDVDTTPGVRRFFAVDTEAKKVEYVNAFERQAVRISTDGSAPAGPPKVAETVPADGATDVDPNLGEIKVTFDQDMDTGGMSWTGNPEMLPPIAPGAKARWVGPRVCVLPVKLEAGHEYRFGINSPSYQNFRSAEGLPVKPVGVSFKTK